MSPDAEENYPGNLEVFCIYRLLDPATAARYAYFIYVVKNAEAVNARKLPSTTLGVRAVDARTLEVTLEHPAPYLPEMLTHTSTMPVPSQKISFTRSARLARNT